MKIRISNKWIGNNQPVFVVAEAGINHNGSLKLAKKIILQAKKSSADAVKFQTFKANDLTSTKSKYYNILKKLELDESDYEDLSDFAKKQKIIFFSTPFSNAAVDLLYKLKVPAFKIASGDLTNIPLIKFAASKKKTMIISTGMANIDEIRNAVNAIRTAKNNKIIIMHSVSAYPTPFDEVNLKALNTLEKKFQYPIGYSDNGSDLMVPIIAVSLGAKIIEKHFTLSHKLKGPDHKLSANPQQLTELIKNIRNAEKMLGDGLKNCQPSEKENRIQVRRSITANVTIQKGKNIKREMIGIKRPATGIEPKFIRKILGKTTLRKIKAGEPLQWKHIR